MSPQTTLAFFLTPFLLDRLRPPVLLLSQKPSLFHTCRPLIGPRSCDPPGAAKDMHVQLGVLDLLNFLWQP